MLLGRNKVLDRLNEVEGQIQPADLVCATCGIEEHYFHEFQHLSSLEAFWLGHMESFLKETRLIFPVLFVFQDEVACSP